MQANYKNWIPNYLLIVSLAGCGLSAILFFIFGIKGWVVSAAVQKILFMVLGIVFLVCVIVAAYFAVAYRAFSYNGKRKLSKQIVEGTAQYTTLPENGVGLDIGCGSGALTIACAKANPKGKMIGIDHWSWEYPSFTQKLCIDNASAEGVNNTEFIPGDAIKLAFADESFDLVTSNYVYHNIKGVKKQKLLEETLRVLKKGGTFAIHDIMSKHVYGDMDEFIQKLKREGYERIELIDTTQGLFMSPWEARILGLSGSKILTGKK